MAYQKQTIRIKNGAQMPKNRPKRPNNMRKLKPVKRGGRPK